MLKNFKQSSKRNNNKIFMTSWHRENAFLEMSARQIVKRRTDNFNNIKPVWRKIQCFFKLVVAYITKVKGKNVVREILAIYNTKSYYPAHVKNKTKLFYVIRTTLWQAKDNNSHFEKEMQGAQKMYSTLFLIKELQTIIRYHFCLDFTKIKKIVFKQSKWWMIPRIAKGIRRQAVPHCKECRQDHFWWEVT